MGFRLLHSPDSVVENTKKPDAVGTAVQHTDIQLWQEFQSGSEAAFAAIYQNHASRLYSYGIKLVNDKEQVMDAIQDLFVELWDTREKLGKVKFIRPYLYKSIRRKLIAGASKKRMMLHSEESEIAIDKSSPSAERSLIEKETFNKEFKALKYALAGLGKKQREIIHLKYYARLNYEEIARVMSMDKKAVYNLMAYTLQLLRKSLDILCLPVLPFYLLYLFF